jgi:hypothetical protein
MARGTKGMQHKRESWPHVVRQASTCFLGASPCRQSSRYGARPVSTVATRRASGFAARERSGISAFTPNHPRASV